MKSFFILLLSIGTLAAQSVTSSGNSSASSNDFKENVRVATTANITIATALNAGDILDGVTLAAGDRVLVKNQSTPSQNGIYTVSASPARASDSNAWSKLAGSLVAVGSEGTTNKNKIFLNDSAPTGTLGSTSLSYIEKAASGVGSGDALVANPLSQFAATTSNQLLTTLNDETGTGVSVFGTSPTFTTSLLTGSTTFSLFNSTATTLNFGGAATTLNIGSSAATVLNFGGAATAAQFRFLEPSGSGTNYTGFKAQAQAGNVTYTLPAADGTSGQVLSTNGTGTLSWATASGGLTGSTGGDGPLDSGKAAVYDSNGYLRGEAVQADNGLYAGEPGVTAGILYLYNSAHSFEATIIPNTGLTADVGVFTPSATGTLATEEWVTAQGYGAGSVAADAIFDAAGDLVYGTGANTAARLAIGTTGQALLTSAGGLPEWTTIPLLGNAQTFTAQNVFSLNPRVPTTDLGTNLASGTALTLGTNYYGTISSAKTLTFSGTPAEGLRTSIKLTVTNAPVLTIPSSKRGGEADSAITTVQLTNGIHNLTWEYKGGEYVLFDTVGRLDNLAGTTAPTANEDIGDGYTVGSVWIDTTNDKTYVCVDQTVTAAVWKQTGGSRTSAQLATDITDETGSGSVVLATNGQRALTTSPGGADDTWAGNSFSGLNNSGGVTQWDAVYLNGSSQWVIADANGSGTYPCRGLVTATASTGAASVVVEDGVVRNDAWTWTPGGTIFLSTTAGGLTQTAPSTTGDKVQVIGYAIDADTMRVKISGDYGTAP